MMHPLTAAAVLSASAAVVGLVTDLLDLGWRGMSWAVATYAVAAVVLLLHRRQPTLSRWISSLGFSGLAWLAAEWLALPGSLSLLAVPTALAAALISPAASAVLGTIETGFLLFLAAGPDTGVEPGTIVIPVGLIWSTVVAVLLVHRQSQQLATSAWEQFQQARHLIEETRDRQVEVKQAIADAASANRQLTLLNEKLATARSAAEQAEQVKTAFVANVSHELRTPLNLILGFSEMITRSRQVYGQALPPALAADLDVVMRNARHLSDMVDDVLDLSQIEAGRMALNKERVAMPEVIEAASAAVRRLCESNGLYLRTEVAQDMPRVFCDRTRIREVILNLLSNAARFTHQGGVRLCARQEGDGLLISVADTGPGIASADLGRIFRPFEQLDSSLQRRSAGSGLGLSISKRFIELHGGQIWFESEVGRGTTFFVRVPIDPVETPVETPVRWLSRDWEYKQRTRRSTAPLPDARPRLVVVDAGRSLQHLLSRHLDGVEIVPAVTLEAAIAEPGQMPAEAILLNEPSVPDALRILQATGPLPLGTPIIICSVPSAAEAARNLGVSAYLVKPFPPGQLLAALDRLPHAVQTVLIIDDEPEALRLYWRILVSASHGYRVLTARNGEEAVELLGEQPDAILLDLVMPEMDGFRFLALRSQNAALRQIPVIIMSARDPAGQPIVSEALAVTQGGGLSSQQLLACIEAIRGVLAPRRPDGQSPLQSRSGSPACE